MPRSPYPLQWPPKTSRTGPDFRRRSKFGDRGQVSPYEAAKELMRELDRNHASHIVITSMLPTRHDGLPYSDGRHEDPGVAVWCVLHAQERVFACDAWLTAGENMRAIELSLEAMRGLDRWGVADAAERAFAGFAALPPGASSSVEAAPVKRPWREVLLGKLAEVFDALAQEEKLDIVRMRYRGLIKQHHPDRGGDTATAAELNVALADAEAELGGDHG